MDWSDLALVNQKRQLNNQTQTNITNNEALPIGNNLLEINDTSNPIKWKKTNVITLKDISYILNKSAIFKPSGTFINDLGSCLLRHKYGILNDVIHLNEKVSDKVRLNSVRSMINCKLS